MGNGLVPSSHVRKHKAEVKMSITIVGVDFQRLLKMSHGLINLSHLRKQKAEVVVRQSTIVVSCDGRPIQVSTSEYMPLCFQVSRKRTDSTMPARCRYRQWAELMRLTLGPPVDTCAHCRGDFPRKSVAWGPGRKKLRALVRDRASIEHFLRHQGLWTEPGGRAEARPPPCFRSITRLEPTPKPSRSPPPSRLARPPHGRALSHSAALTTPTTPR